MNNDIRMRQADLINADKLSSMSVCVVGCGGIGSHTAMALARMGVTDMTIFDPDIVAEHNVSSQGFDIDDIGKPKVEVTMRKIVKAVRVVPKIKRQLVTETTDLRKFDVVIMAVDSMKARKEIATSCSHQGVSFIINPAMGAEVMTMTVHQRLDDADWLDEFNKEWFNDSDGVQETCTSKATIYTTLMISSYICKVIKDINEESSYTRKIIYDIANNRPTLMFSSIDEDLTE